MEPTAWPGLAGESILSLGNLQRIKTAYLTMLLSLGGVALGGNKSAMNCKPTSPMYKQVVVNHTAVQGMKKNLASRESQPCSRGWPCSQPQPNPGEIQGVAGGRAKRLPKRGGRGRNRASKPYRGGMTPRARGCPPQLSPLVLDAPPMAGSCLHPAPRRLNAFDNTPPTHSVTQTQTGLRRKNNNNNNTNWP